MFNPLEEAGIHYHPYDSVKYPPYFNYELQIEAGLGVCKASVIGKEPKYVMCFGYPGTGKSTFATQLVKELAAGGQKTNLLVVSCNTLLSKAPSISTVIENLNRTVQIAESKRPLIFVLDEFDAITQDRLLSIRRENVNEFTLWFMDTLSNNFSENISNENNPEHKA